MLSYQHAFHAGNLADVHKHALLAWMLDYLTRKDKPLSYIETHAGRGVYDLAGNEARKTGEAAQGIAKVADWFETDHPYARALAHCAQEQGQDSYPGSPAVARALLRPTDSLHLAELHPAEHDILRAAFRKDAKIYKQDGFEMAHALSPPTPRRGLLLIDPPYEIKTDYTDIPRHIAKLTRAWNVGIVALWYPILTSDAQAEMARTIARAHPGAMRSEVRFPPAREGHGMVGSGLLVVNPPFGTQDEALRLSKKFATLTRAGR